MAVHLSPNFSTPILRVNDLRKEFLTSGVRKKAMFTAVKNVSFELGGDESLAVVGESGSGKTTVAKIIVGLEVATEGTITVSGQDRSVPAKNLKERRIRASEVQYVFQDPYASLNGRQRVGQIILSSLRLYHKKHLSRNLLDEQALEILASVGLPHKFFNRYPKQLSGGQRQRVAIARAIASNPRVMIFDEAVAALDVSTQAQILNLLADIRLKRRVSYLFITHDLAVANQVSERMIVMEKGCIVDQGKTTELLSNPSHGYTRALRAAVPGPGWKPKRRGDLGS